MLSKSLQLALVSTALTDVVVEISRKAPLKPLHTHTRATASGPTDGAAIATCQCTLGTCIGRFAQCTAPLTFQAEDDQSLGYGYFQLMDVAAVGAASRCRDRSRARAATELSLAWSPETLLGGRVSGQKQTPTLEPSRPNHPFHSHVARVIRVSTGKALCGSLTAATEPSGAAHARAWQCRLPPTRGCDGDDGARAVRRYQPPTATASAGGVAPSGSR
jgi:hypothetical protein